MFVLRLCVANAMLTVAKRGRIQRVLDKALGATELVAPRSKAKTKSVTVHKFSLRNFDPQIDSGLFDQPKRVEQVVEKRERTRKRVVAEPKRRPNQSPQIKQERQAVRSSPHDWEDRFMPVHFIR